MWMRTKRIIKMTKQLISQRTHFYVCVCFKIFSKSIWSTTAHKVFFIILNGIFHLLREFKLIAGLLHNDVVINKPMQYYREGEISILLFLFSAFTMCYCYSRWIDSTRLSFCCKFWFNYCSIITCRVFWWGVSEREKIVFILTSCM